MRPLLIATLLLGALLSGAPLLAATPATGWEAHPEQARVARIASTYHVRLIAGEAWRPGELEAIELGLAALPESLRPQADAPLDVVRQKETCLFGMGRDSKRCPTFDKDHTTFYLYTLPAEQGSGPMRPLRALTQPERAMLWRARAMIHMALRHDERVEAWALRREWRMINGWNARGKRAFNRDEWGFSRYEGRLSSQLDLITFAEEYFVRAEDILRHSAATDARDRLQRFDWNLSLGCQEFTKIRILTQLINELEPTYAPPLRSPRDTSPQEICTEFERWAQAQDIEGVDILLAAATSDNPESLYGHLLLTVRYREGQIVRSRGFDPVFQYGAITDTNVNKVEYFSKGLFGGFLSIIQPNTFRGTDRLFMQYEQRTLRRYALNLSPRQLRQVIERLWEAERHVTYPYYFLSDNCASMLIDLLSPAIDDVELPEPVRFGLMPTEVLDVFASVNNGERGPLLVKRAETHFSSREVAMDAVPRRRLALSRLSDQLEDPALSRTLVQIDASLDQRDPELRAATYARLTETLTRAIAAAPDEDARDRLTREAIDYLYYCSRIERYFMDLAFYQRRLIQSQALKDPVQLTAEEQIQMRRDLYMEEDLEARQEAILALASIGDARLRDGERRPYTEQEQEKLTRIESTQRAYLASLEAMAATIETHSPELDGVQFVQEKVDAFEREQRRRDALSMGPPGKGRFLVGMSGGALTDTRGALEQGLFLEASASVVHERLGEQRRRGFRSDIASRAAGLDVEVVLGERAWQRLRVDATLFEFMTLEQLMGPVRKSWRDAFGWGMRLGGQHDGRRGLYAAVLAEAGYVLPLWVRDNVANFLVFGLYGQVRSDWTAATDDPDLFGARAFMLGQLHLYGRYANALRFELSTTQYGRFDALSHEWDLYGQVQSEHVLGEVGQQLLLARPYLRAERTTLNYLGSAEDRDAFMSFRAGLSFELPF